MKGSHSLAAACSIFLLVLWGCSEQPGPETTAAEMPEATARWRETLHAILDSVRAEVM